MNNTQKMYFKNCNEKTKDCQLTKKELCERIKEHYVGRMKLAKFIRRQLPFFDNRTGRWKAQGLCFDRLSSLRDGKYCLSPAPLRKGRTNNSNIEKYAGKMNKQSCIDAGGFYMELTEKQKEVLFSNKNKFNVFYTEFLLKIQNDYKLLLIELLNILNIMETELAISNQALNELTNKAIEIVKQARMKCQKNYEGALIALYQSELDKSVEIVEKEENLASRLENRLKN